MRGALPRAATCLGAVLLALAGLSGCAGPAGDGAGPERPPWPGPPDRTVTLPSGATLTVAGDWTVTALADGATLRDPEGQLRIDLVEVEGENSPGAAIATAWSRRRPGFDRAELAASDAPGRDGWDRFRWSSYTKRNRDGTTSFVTIDPGVRGFEFTAPPSGGVYRRLRLHDSQHAYDYEALDG